MKKIMNLFTLCIFLFIIFGFSIGTILKEDIIFSENKNKYLTQKPDFQINDILSGKYMENVNLYMNDQLFLRYQLLQYKTSFQKSIKNKEINGVYLGKNRLFEKWTQDDIDTSLLDKNMKIVNQFATTHPQQPVQVMLVPTAEYIYDDALPLHAPIVNQDKLIDKIYNTLEDTQNIDIRNILKKQKSNDLYYHTDHHWTTKGAFLAYQEYMKEHHLNKSESYYQRKCITHYFYGSLYSKILDDSVKQDKIELYEDQNQLKYEVSYNNGSKKSNTVYDMERLDKKDKYLVFLGGNHPEITIKTENHNRKSLLIFKDSFANAFIPFLINDYEKIYVIDLRYFKNNINEYIQNNPVDEYLFLYCTKNFVSNDFTNLLMD